MKLSSHTTIRYCEPDDTAFVRALYYDGIPRASLLDGRRERMLPRRAEILEILQKSEAARAMLFSIEDETGSLCGWGGLRGLNPDARFAELFLIFAHEDHYASPYAAEALEYLLKRAFYQTRLTRLLASCLHTETAWRACLVRKGFVSCGIQRDVLFAGGCWRDLETLELEASAFSSVDPEMMEREDS
ncbi:MAG: GNAT family N-acetyltransferase [Candidatus Hydrogenedens sp.]|jgi:RimJ/RimL family protein N-acetyltransferase|nr:GNAT family N-acetyltransferase [Candidatus Hydrogenedens sp.]